MDSDWDIVEATLCLPSHVVEIPDDDDVASEHTVPWLWYRTWSKVHICCESTSTGPVWPPRPESAGSVQIAAVPALGVDVRHPSGPEW